MLLEFKHSVDEPCQKKWVRSTAAPGFCCNGESAGTVNFGLCRLIELPGEIQNE